jgi:hypothetical protein
MDILREYHLLSEVLVDLEEQRKSYEELAGIQIACESDLTNQ